MFHVRWLVITVLISLTALGSMVHCAQQEQHSVTLAEDTTPSGTGNGGGGGGGGSGTNP